MEYSVEFIDLGNMSVEEGVWRPHTLEDFDGCNEKCGYDPDLGIECTCTDESVGEDPDEIVIPFATAELIFILPFDCNLRFTFEARDGKGFTRREIAIRIMAKYHSIFAEEAMLMRADPDQRYVSREIFGHSLRDIYLGSLIITDNPQVFKVHVST
jgi:hypothetical protein